MRHVIHFALTSNTLDNAKFHQAGCRSLDCSAPSRAMPRSLLGFLVFLGCTTLVARAELRLLQIESGLKGPTVLVVAVEGGAGPCALAALRQAARISLDRGRLILVESVSPFSALPRLPGWTPHEGDSLPGELQELPRLVLREAPEARANLPAAEGQTVRGSDPAAAMIRAHLQCLPGAPGAAWLPAGRSDRPNEIAVTTSAKDPRTTNRPASRERAFRTAVTAFLKHHGLRGASDAAPAVFPDPSPGLLRVAVYDDDGSVSSSGHGPSWLQSTLATHSDLLVELVGSPEIHAGVLAATDVLVMGGGSANTQGQGLGKEGREAICAFVRNGGGYLGICAGAFLACESTARPFLGLLPVSPRGTSLKCSTPLAWSGSPTGPTRFEDALMSNGPLLLINDDADSLAPDLAVWARFDRDEGQGTKAYPLRGTAAVLAAGYGQGRVVIFSPHCERPPSAPACFPSAVRWAGRTQTRP